MTRQQEATLGLEHRACPASALLSLARALTHICAHTRTRTHTAEPVKTGSGAGANPAPDQEAPQESTNKEQISSGPQVVGAHLGLPGQREP